MTSPERIQLIINICLALGSLGLLVVTLIYTSATRRMAREMKNQSDMMQKEFEIRIAPLVEPKFTHLFTNVINPVWTMTVTNKGFYPIKFEYIHVRCWHREKPDIAEADVIQIHKWLEKGESLSHVIKFHFSRIALFRSASDTKQYGMASAELHFVDIEKKQFILNKGKVFIGN